MKDERFNSIQINYLDFDIYSKSIGFFFHDKERIGSLFGFTLTIIYILITLCLFIFYTVSTINKSDIKVHDSVLYQKEAPEMIINSDFFYFAFGIENNSTGFTRFIDETIYYPEVIYVNKIKEGSIFREIEEKPLIVERCVAEKFGTDYQDLLVEGELNNSYCISDFNLSLAGNFKYNKLSYIKINIYPCVNNSQNNNHCKPREIIDSHLSGTFISFLTKDIGLEPANYSFPVVSQFQDIYVTIDKSYFRDFVIFFGITEIQTDQGLFFEKLDKKRYINYIKTSQGIYYKDINEYYNGSSICEVQIRMSDDIRVQKRTYRKMSEVFAITGGYMQLISTIFSIITFLTKKIDHEVQIVNSIFNFYPKKKKISLKHQFHKISTQSSNFKNNRNFSFQKVKNPINNSVHSVKSIEIIKKQNYINGKTSENNKNKNNNKAKNDNSYIDENNNKSKNGFLTLGIKQNYSNKKRSIFEKSIIFEKKESIIEDIKKGENKKKNIKFNSFYYYCISNSYKKNKEIIKLFNFAISFYKQKMDIIYLFHILLLFEKILENGNFKIIKDDETFFQLNDI